MNIKQLNQFAEKLYEDKKYLDSLNQEIAENFYPERSSFTYQRELGEEFAENLLTSYPVLVRRELADQTGSMLRPVGQPWFEIIAKDPERNKNDEAKRWLEAATHIQRRAMYDPVALFDRATKEGDNDFMSFGQCSISSELVLDHPGEGPHLLHRTWHLRDMAWVENQFGQIGSRFRKWKPTAMILNRLFPGKVSKKVENMATGTGKKPLTEVDVIHMVVEADLYDDINAGNKPWVSIFYDRTHKHVIQQVPTYSWYYNIPRFQTVSGSQYAFSPATIVGLPDARLIQAMARTLLEAGEKAVNPPMIATEDTVRSDVSIYPGGLTWVDQDYDERLGDALRPISLDIRGIPIGQDMLDDVKTLLWNVFYLNKLTFPQRTAEMTAYEVSQRIQQYIRDALPLFGPMETDYNGSLCELDFQLLQRGGAFGSPFDMPKALQGADVTFQFTSPLHDAVDAEKAQKFLEMRTLLAEAVQMDQSTLAIPDAKVAFRDALDAAGVPMDWIRSEPTVRQIENAARAQKESAELLETMKTGSEVAVDTSQAVANLSQNTGA